MGVTQTYVVGELSILRREDTVGEVECGEVVPCCHVLADILVEELEYERDAVGEDQVLPHVLKLVHVVHLEVFQQQQEDG